MKYSLVLNEAIIPIGKGGAVLGRSMACSVRLDGEGVSRRHARLTLEGNGVTVEDLGSVHGVLLNGAPIAAATVLRHGDIITVGTHALRFSARPASSPQPPARAAPTPLDTIWDDDEEEFGDGEVTCRDNLLLMIAPGVDELLDGGKVEEAARTFTMALDAALAGARTERRLEPQVNETATNLALRLARASDEQRWVDSLLELQVAAKSPPPVELLGELVAAVEQVGTAKADVLRAWVDMAHGKLVKTHPVAAKALSRLEQLSQRGG